jgi:hypothetical protein
MTGHASNPSAFPSGLKATNIESNGGRYEGTYVDEYASAEGGMTLRDYFAAKAMQALSSLEYRALPDELAGHAYCMADAMLKAREA